MNFLGFFLLAPWFAVLGWLYWRSAPTTFVAHRRTDSIVLVAAVLLSLVGLQLGLQFDPDGHHPIIRQIIASVVAYKAFLLVLGGAFFWRRNAARAALEKR